MNTAQSSVGKFRLFRIPGAATRAKKRAWTDLCAALLCKHTGMPRRTADRYARALYREHAHSLGGDNAAYLQLGDWREAQP